MTNWTAFCKSSVLAGIPSTIVGAAVGEARTVFVWQSAQLNPT